MPEENAMKNIRFLSLLLMATLLSACVSVVTTPPTPHELAVANQLGLGQTELTPILSKQIYQMTPNEAGRYIKFIHVAEPDLAARIAAIGRKNIGQPYSLNLLGEFPYEIHDALPMFSLEQSDCVVFSEHTYAMALSNSWEEFFWMLQRIRYKDGVIGVTSRNHYTEVDWNVNNAWLLRDISAELAGVGGPSYRMTVDRSNFLKKRHYTNSNFPVQSSEQFYVAKERVAEIEHQLQQGDYVNVISTKDGAYWASHVGLVVIDAQGKRNFLNSAEPKVREESFAAFMVRTTEREQRQAREGKNGQKLAGFKFLRLNEQIIVPPAAPQPRPGQLTPR
jgi:hypothetical protein